MEAGVAQGRRRQVQVHVDAIVFSGCGENCEQVREAVEVGQELHGRAKSKIDLQENGLRGLGFRLRVTAEGLGVGFREP